MEKIAEKVLEKWKNMVETIWKSGFCGRIWT